MSCVSQIINRGDPFQEEDIVNKWKWEWTEKKVTVDGAEQRVSACFRKVDKPGIARCLLCNKELSYANRGLTALVDHMGSKKHIDATKASRNQSHLPGQPLGREGTYGMDPVLKAADIVNPSADPDPFTPLADRVSNLEALTLAFVAENNMSLRDVPKLVQYAKAMANDKTALQDVRLGDKDTASYKLVYGLAAALENSLLEELRTTPFSLNIDEATSKTHKRMVAVLVSHFSSSAQRLVIHHLAAFSLTQVTAEAIFNELETLFEKLNLPWANLVSVLLDSCAVMRGSKKGLETLIKQKHAPHLLDIDGDSIHHVHNATKIFCRTFNNFLEGLMNDLYNDFKWSSDLKARLGDFCTVLGLLPTIPERYVPHRWLSVLDVALDTVRLFDAYILFYYSFLSAKDLPNYLDVMKEVLERCSVSEIGKKSVLSMQKYLRKKFTTFTKEGKDRKLRIIEKIFMQRARTEFLMNLYTHVLPDLKKYVLFFQRREPSMHLLHSQQQELFTSFCGNFLTPECLAGDVKKMNIEDDENQLSDRLLYTGTDYNKLKKDPDLKAFLKQVRAAYIACGKSLQQKMPLNKAALKVCAALDPEVRRTKTCLSYLIKMPSHFVQDKDLFLKEVRLYNVDSTINSGHGISVDEYWNRVDKDKYPCLTKAAKALLSSFHGPIVECAFSDMSLIMDDTKGSMIDETYQAVQTVRFHLKSVNKSAVEAFQKKDPLRQPVDKNLCRHMREAYKGRQERQKANRVTKNKKFEELGAPTKMPSTKKADKEKLLNKAAAARSDHRLSVNVDIHVTPSPGVVHGDSCSDETSTTAIAKGKRSAPEDSDQERPPAKKKVKQSSLFSFFH